MKSAKLLLALALLLLLLLSQGSALACALAFRGHAETQGEEALIVWNPDTKVQHFIRRAQFITADKDIGFLVPTPTVPKLSEVDQEIFKRLHAEIQPRERILYDPVPALSLWLYQALFMGAVDRAKAGSRAGSVQLLEQTRVAGYQAAVLKATDAGAIMAWLKQNGYPARPELSAWLAPYLQKHWIITAFKLDQSGTKTEPGQARLNLKALDMRFVTARPFYPYREPDFKGKSQALDPRSLRIYYLGPGPANGGFSTEKDLFDDGNEQMNQLITSGETERLYSAPLKAEQRRTLLGTSLPEADLPSGSWLNAWADFTQLREPLNSGTPNAQGPEELYFYAASGEPYLPYNTVHQTLVLPLDLGLAGVVGLLFWRRRKRRAA